MQSDIFGSRRRLLHSFVQLAIKNQALRERTCQRHVFFEAHRGLNKEILSYGFFFSLFHRMLKEVKYFSPPLVSPRQTNVIARRLRRRRWTCLVTYCESPSPPTVPPADKPFIDPPMTPSELNCVYGNGSAPCSDCGDSFSRGRQKKRTQTTTCVLRLETIKRALSFVEHPASNRPQAEAA